MSYRRFAVGAVVMAFISTPVAAGEEPPQRSGRYFGLEPPGATAQVFDPGIFPKDEIQGCSGFLNDGTAFVFGSMKRGADWRLRPIYLTELRNGTWTSPRIAPFSRYSAYNFTIGPDGQTVYFTSLTSPDTTTRMLLEQANIWAVKLETDGWTEPIMFGPSLNTERYFENYPSVTTDGTIYYMSSRPGGIGRTDVYRSPRPDAVYGQAENLGRPINTEGSDIDPFVAADESYLIVCQERDGGFGGFDLYVSFHQPDDSWSQPANLGPGVNSAGFEARPSVTPDGRFLFFTSHRPDEGNREDIYWVDASVIGSLRPDPE